MEPHKIDSIIRKAVNESENFYNSDANDAKERIWQHVQRQKQNQVKQPIFRLLVAACILLFISLSVVTISTIKHKKAVKTLAELNATLRNELAIKSNRSIMNESVVATHVKIPDTIYIEKKVVEYIALLPSKPNTDTVYIQQLVYVDSEQAPALQAENENSYPTDSMLESTENYYKSEIIISNNESLKRGKVRKIQIKFGSNKDQIDNGTLAFTAKL